MIPKSAFVFPDLLAPDEALMRVMLEYMPGTDSFIEIINRLIISLPYVQLEFERPTRIALMATLNTLWKNNTSTDTDTHTDTTDISDFHQHTHLITQPALLAAFLNIILGARYIVVKKLQLAMDRDDTQVDQLGHFKATEKRIHFMIDIANIIIDSIGTQEIPPELHRFLIAIYADIFSNIANISIGFFEKYFSGDYRLLTDCFDSILHKVESLNTISLLTQKNDAALVCMLDIMEYAAPISFYEITYYYTLGQDEKAQQSLAKCNNIPPNFYKSELFELVYNTLLKQFKAYIQKLDGIIAQYPKRSTYIALGALFGENGHIHSQDYTLEKNFSMIISKIIEYDEVSLASEAIMKESILALGVAFEAHYFESNVVLAYCQHAVQYLRYMIGQDKPYILAYQLEQQLDICQHKIDLARPILRQNKTEAAPEKKQVRCMAPVPPMKIGISKEMMSIKRNVQNKLHFILPFLSILGQSDALDLPHLTIHEERGLLVLPRVLPYEGAQIIMPPTDLPSGTECFFSVFKNRYNALKASMMGGSNMELLLSYLEKLWKANQTNSPIPKGSINLFNAPNLPSQLINCIIGTRGHIIEHNKNIFSLDQKHWLPYFIEIEKRMKFMGPIAHVAAAHITLTNPDPANSNPDFAAFQVFLTIILDDIISTVHNISNGLLYDYFTQNHSDLSIVCENFITMGNSIHQMILRLKIALANTHVCNILSLLSSWDVYQTRYYYATGQDQKALYCYNNPQAISMPSVAKQYECNRQILQQSIEKNKKRALYSNLLQCIDEESSSDTIGNSYETALSYLTEFSFPSPNDCTEDTTHALKQSIWLLKKANKQNYDNNLNTILACKKIATSLLSFFQQDPYNILSIRIQEFIVNQLQKIEAAQLGMTSNNANNSALAQYTQTKNKAEQLKTKLAHLKIQKNTLESAHTQASANANEAIANIRASIEKAQTTELSLRETLGSIQENIKTIEPQVATLQSDITALEKTKSTETNTLRATQLHLKTLQTQVRKLEKQKNDLTQTHSTAQTAQAAQQSQILTKQQSYQETIKKLEIQHKDYQTKQEQIHQKMQEEQLRLEQQKKANTQLMTQKTEQQTSHEESIKHLSQQLVTLEEEHQTLTLQNRTLQSHCQALDQALKNALALSQVANQYNLQEDSRWQTNITALQALFNTLTQYLSAKCNTPILAAPPPVYTAPYAYPRPVTYTYPQPISSIPSSTLPSAPTSFTPIVNLSTNTTRLHTPSASS